MENVESTVKAPTVDLEYRNENFINLFASQVLMTKGSADKKSRPYIMYRGKCLLLADQKILKGSTLEGDFAIADQYVNGDYTGCRLLDRVDLQSQIQISQLENINRKTMLLEASKQLLLD